MGNPPPLGDTKLALQYAKAHGGADALIGKVVNDSVFDGDSDDSNTVGHQPLW
ncbi:MAG: hypothetical protein HC886_16560 [Leptolyngbyaceae cyanobacterium SM1_1_3]|nr:hypothetical protein [Leptolyngbyaceae cyanobacterium SM1_1_3]NJN04879.1 hypothetical protein [Leptolyngbyaceae cyanobacterium RM1_1_2]NJO12064.1 hypothetical protein [Leptolyngbyaceae cyanobacterium SL_1_1]